MTDALPVRRRSQFRGRCMEVHHRIFAPRSSLAPIGRALLFRLALPAVGAGAVLVGVAGPAAAQEHVVVRVAPPTPRLEIVPRAPSAHHFWVHGYWGYHPQHQERSEQAVTMNTSTRVTLGAGHLVGARRLLALRGRPLAPALRTASATVVTSRRRQK